MSQSNYYPSKERITEEEIDSITDMIEEKGIGSENTRLQKLPRNENESIGTFHVLLTSAEKDPEPQLIEEITIGDQRAKVFLCRGDHAAEMEKVCLELMEARKYALTPEQRTELLDLVRCFQTGNYQNAFQSFLRTTQMEHITGLKVLLWIR